MDMYIQKQLQFYDLADKYYSEAMNEYRVIDSYSQYIEEEDFRLFKMQLATKMGLACEYYLKGMLFPLLEINLPDDDNLKSIINSLGDEERYKLLIGEGASVINRISVSTGKKKSELNFLRENSLKSSQHNILKIIDQIVDNCNKLSDKICEERQKLYKSDYSKYEKDEIEKKLAEKETIIEHVGTIKNDLISAIEDIDYSDINLSSLVNNNSIDKEKEISSILRRFSHGDIEDVNNTDLNIYSLFNTLMEESNINNAFCEARYAHLDNEYDLNCFLLGKVLGIIRNVSCYNSCLFLEAVSNNKTSGNIKRIYPDLNSKVYIINNMNVNRAYKVQTYSKAVKDLLKENNDYNIEQKICLEEIKDLAENDFYYDCFACSIEKGIPILYEDDDSVEVDFFKCILPVGLWAHTNSINVSEGETVCYYHNGELNSYTNYYNSNNLLKNKSEVTDKFRIMINCYENTLSTDKEYMLDKEIMKYVWIFDNDADKNIKIKKKVNH